MKNKQKPMQNKETNKKDNGKKKETTPGKSLSTNFNIILSKRNKKREWEENKHN